ncbi:reverse transcriptase domain-containing protein [Tanacetum coccineum]
MTSEASHSKKINETGFNKNEPPRFEQDVQEKPHDDGEENKSSSIRERTTEKLVKPQQSSVPFPNRVRKEKEKAMQRKFLENLKQLDINIPFIEALVQIPKYAKYLKKKDPMSFTIPCQVLEKHKEAEDLAADNSSRLENPHMEVLIEREIADKFFDEHLMALKSKSNNDEPWYADFVNYIVGKVVPPNWTFKKRKRCVDGSETLKILVHCHSGPTGGHHSANVTAKKVYKFGFYWPSVFKDANEYVSRCDTCQRLGNISSWNEMPQYNIQVCEVFDVWGLNFMGPFPESRGNKYILVAVDYVSKWFEAQALPTNDARVVVKFLRQLFARFGVPKDLISDRGTHFCNSQLEKAFQRYGVTHKLSTAYHPQSNGQIEVTSSAIKHILERSVGTILKPHGAMEITDRDGFSFKVNGLRLNKYYGGNIGKEDDEVLEFEDGVT